MDRTPKPCLHPQAKHEHGTRLAYTLDGCRCWPCCHARSVYGRQLAYGRKARQDVDPTPVREHVAKLQAAGLGTRRIAELAGVNRKALQRLHARKYVTAEIADRVLAVPLTSEPGGAQLIDATGTHRRMQALSALGWSNVKLARELGMTVGNYGAMLKRPLILARHACEVRELYDRLSTRVPVPTSGYDEAGIKRVKAAAERNGWAPPLAWDDDTIDDPKARPNRGPVRVREFVIDDIAVQRVIDGDRALSGSLHKRERAEVVRRLVALGWNDQQIERRTRISDRTVIRIRHRADDERSA